MTKNYQITRRTPAFTTYVAHGVSYSEALKRMRDIKKAYCAEAPRGKKGQATWNATRHSFFACSFNDFGERMDTIIYAIEEGVR
jgi:hypothetical protein